jgi:sec-independent protein translocase protein TatC
MGNEETKLTILDHLKELRQRLIKCVIVVAIAAIISFIFWEWLLNILIFPAGGIDLIYIELTEMVGITMKVSLTGALILAMPYIIYQLILFIAPALTRNEKKYLYLVTPWIVLMFAIGVIFCYFVLLPPALKFLITFGSGIATPQIRVGNYISIVSRLLLVIGLVFELPVVTTFLARIGVLKSQWLASKRKVAIIVAFILAAIITPTFDPINQSLVAIPLVILYELSIWLAKLVERKRADTAEPVTTSAS